MKSKPSLLLVEQDEGIKELLIHFFQKEYALITAKNTIEALRYIYEGNLPNVLIIDLTVNDISSIELVQQIKNNGILKDIPTVLLADKSEEDNVKENLSSMVHNILFKPFDPNELKEIINELS